MRRKLSFFSISVMIGGLLSASELHAGSASTTFSFSAFFYGGTCQVDVPSTVPYGTVPDNTIPNNQQSRSFSLNLLGCQGYFLNPRISVSGNTITADNDELLYADPSSTTKGYGVRLSTPGNTVFNKNDNTAKINEISARNWDKSKEGKLLDGPLEFEATLSCGNCTAGDKLQNGELIATVTFSFLYD